MSEPQDYDAIGIDNDGNVICWDAAKREPYNTGSPPTEEDWREIARNAIN